MRRGEALIAGVFGLVHGLAFAGILTDLGLDGATSLATLLAFNVGVELAQLTATMSIFPSLYLLARSRAYARVRMVGGALAIAAAAGWVLERLGVVSSPLRPFEDVAVSHPWAVVGMLAVVAVTTWGLDRSQEPRFVVRS